MKNIQIFFLATIISALSITTPTHSMENNDLLPIICSQENIVQGNAPKAIKELQIKRNDFKKKLEEQKVYWWLGLTPCPLALFLNSTYRQKLHGQTYNEAYKLNPKFINVKDEKCFGCFNIDNLKELEPTTLEILHSVRIGNYSALGSAAITHNVSFAEKNIFIQKLLTVGFISTPEDKELALIEKWECFYFYCMYPLYCTQEHPQNPFGLLPRELVRFITLLTWTSEKSLF